MGKSMSLSLRQLLGNKNFWNQVLINLAIVLSLQWIIHALFFSNRQEKQDICTITSGQMIAITDYANTASPLARPLAQEIDFIDSVQEVPEEKKVISTACAEWVFTSHGAALEQVTVRAGCDGVAHDLSLLHDLTPENREFRTFLVAFDKVTPYTYKCVAMDETDTQVVLEYKADTPDISVTKRFVISKNSYKIDMTLICDHINDGLKEHAYARIIVPAPFIAGNVAQAAVKGIVVNESKTLQKIQIDAYKEAAWIAPSLIGLEDRYALSTLVADDARTVLRGYYGFGGQGQPILFVETKPLEMHKAYTYSWYVGPKEVIAMNAVDSRLEETLEYGWFAFFSRLMLKALKFLYSYVHNYGLAIILLILLMKLFMMPFTLSGERRMRDSAKANAEMQRKLKYLEQKYKDDKEALAREKMEVMRKHGFGGMSGCIPLLLQIPLFIALNRVLSSSIELYKAPFLWIPDLSNSDPYYIIPVLAGLAFFFHKSAPVDDARKGVFNSLLALFICGIAANLSAGLGLFIVVSTWLGVVQTFFAKVFKA